MRRPLERVSETLRRGSRRLVSELRHGDWRGAARRVGWGCLRLVLETTALLLASISLFVVATALLGRVAQPHVIRWLLGLAVAVVLPLAVQGQAAQLLMRWLRLRLHIVRFVTLFDVALVALLLLLSGSGEALRRRGDWFYGKSETAEAQFGRSVIRVMASLIERFHLPSEMEPQIVEPKAGVAVQGPTLEAGTAPVAEARRLAWIHPLVGERAMPSWESRRYGAERDHSSPPECESGHCGVDLAADFGAPVLATFDGVVERAERDARTGGLAGRFIRLGHLDGLFVTRYLHLDRIRADLREGDHVVAGECIGRVGRTGVIDSDTHLHFALSSRPARPGEKERYLDPEPFLARWDVKNSLPVLPPEPRPAPGRRTRIARR